jgi:hypothetical protein
LNAKNNLICLPVLHQLIDLVLHGLESDDSNNVDEGHNNIEVEKFSVKIEVQVQVYC